MTYQGPGKSCHGGILCWNRKDLSNAAMEHKPLQSEDLPEDLLYRSHSQVLPVQAGFSDRQADCQVPGQDGGSCSYVRTDRNGAGLFDSDKLAMKKLLSWYLQNYCMEF